MSHSSCVGRARTPRAAWTPRDKGKCFAVFVHPSSPRPKPCSYPVLQCCPRSSHQAGQLLVCVASPLAQTLYREALPPVRDEPKRNRNLEFTINIIFFLLLFWVEVIQPWNSRLAVFQDHWLHCSPWMQQNCMMGLCLFLLPRPLFHFAYFMFSRLNSNDLSAWRILTVLLCRFVLGSHFIHSLSPCGGWQRGKRGPNYSAFTEWRCVSRARQWARCGQCGFIGPAGVFFFFKGTHHCNWWASNEAWMSVDPPEEMSSYPYHGRVCVCVFAWSRVCVSWRMCVCVRPCILSVYVCVCHGLIPSCWQCWYTLASHRMHDGSL